MEIVTCIASGWVGTEYPVPGATVIWTFLFLVIVDCAASVRLEALNVEGIVICPGVPLRR
jgi:hypothetical protein